MSELHPIQRAMRKLEDQSGPGKPGTVPVDAVIAELIDFRGDIDGELDPILLAENQRVVELYNQHYVQAAGAGVQLLGGAAQALAMVGFLQGVTFAAAVRKVSEDGA